MYLQNIPQYALVLLALWKLGATALVLNPMYRGEELRRLIDDSGATGIICADADADETRTTLDGSTVRWTVSTSALADRQYPTQRAAHVRRRRPRHRRTPMSSTTCQRACHEHSCPLS